MPSWVTDRPLVCLEKDMGGHVKCCLCLLEVSLDLRSAVERERHSVEGIPHHLIEVDAFVPS